MTEHSPAVRVHKRTFRPDIQGLRAVAVILVIADHLTLLQRLPGHPEGGFIGVDIFFVISGFLITGHLVSEVSRNGRVNYRQFYTRRARRILPMAVLVAVVSVASSFIVFWPSRAFSSLWDGIWSLLFVSNIHYSVAGTDYFNNPAPSIFQHYWSLSVEEQFYLVWPLVIMLSVGIALRMKKNLTVMLCSVIGLSALASFVWACIDTNLSPTSAYFSTMSRGFEFAAGGLLAVCARQLHELPQAVRPALTVLGLLGIVGAVYFIAPGDGFPGPLAILPALSTILIIAAGTGRVQRPSRIPGISKTTSYIGDISYSLYLWHWPVIVIIAALVPTTPGSIAAVVAITFILAALSYRYVETPFQRRASIAQSRSLSAVPAALRITAGVATVALLMTVVVATAPRSVGAEQNEPPIASGDDDPLARALQLDIREAHRRSNWEGMTPPIDELVSDADDLDESCWNDRVEIEDTCTIGPADAEHSIAVVGDSLAMNWIPALRAIVADRPGWNLEIYAKVGCVFADVEVYDVDGSLYDSCPAFRERAIHAVNASAPDIVVLASGLKKTLPGASDPTELVSRWAEGVSRTLDKLNSRAIVLAAPPEGIALVSCANRFSTPDDCSSSVSSHWTALHAATEEVVLQHNSTFINTAEWLCTSSGWCPAVVNDIAVRRDTVHMTAAYSASLSNVLENRLFITDGRVVR